MSSERRFGAFGHVPPASSPLSEIPSFLRETPNGAINKVEVKRRRSDAQTSKNHKSGDPTVDIRFHNEPDTYVAHYTRCDIALDLILKHRRIRLGHLTATNDPRETKGWSFAVGVSWFQDGVSHQDGLALAKRNIDFNRIIRSGCRVFAYPRIRRTHSSCVFTTAPMGNRGCGRNMAAITQEFVYYSTSRFLGKKSRILWNLTTSCFQEKLNTVIFLKCRTHFHGCGTWRLSTCLQMRLPKMGLN